MNKTDRIIEAYQEWDPAEESITELAARLGISRSRLYQALNARGVTPKTRRGPHMTSDGLLAEMAEQALGFLLNEVTELRSEIAEYRQKYGPLD